MIKMNWFGKNSRSSTSSSSGSSGGSGSKHGSFRSKPSKTMPVQANTDPETYLDVFRIHWKQAWNVISPPDTVQGVRIVPLGSLEEVETVVQNVEKMINLMLHEESNVDRPGQLLQYLLDHDILAKFYAWCTCIVDYAEKLKCEQLKMFESLICQSKQPILVHKPIIRPLLKLLQTCSDYLDDYRSEDLEQHLVLVLHQICVCISQQTLILEEFFSMKSDEFTVDNFLIFALLIPYIHREGPIGQQARDALLLIMALSAKHVHIGTYIAERSNFCPVLATGLSGLYSSLPRKLTTMTEDWYRLTDDDISQMPDLQMFLNSLEFCNAVAQVAYSQVRDQLIDFIYNGFLLPVLGPALHQDVTGVPLSLIESRLFVNSHDQILAATAYLELFLRRITEPYLLKAFLKFILTEKFDDSVILQSLIARVNTNSKLCVVSLSLFKTLVELNCEDVMFELILRYLIPCTHVMVSQRRAIKELDLYSKSAEKFLGLRPMCCLTRESLATGGTGDASQNSSGSAVFYTNASTNPGEGQKQSKRFPRMLRSHKKALSFERQAIIDGSRVYPINGTYMNFESSYLDYLQDAHTQVSHCAMACQNWTALYNGDDPSPDSLVDTTVSLSSSSNVPLSRKFSRPPVVKLFESAVDGAAADGKDVNSMPLEKINELVKTSSNSDISSDIADDSALPESLPNGIDMATSVQHNIIHSDGSVFESGMNSTNDEQIYTYDHHHHKSALSDLSGDLLPGHLDVSVFSNDLTMDNADHFPCIKDVNSVASTSKNLTSTCDDIESFMKYLNTVTTDIIDDSMALDVEKDLQEFDSMLSEVSESSCILDELSESIATDASIDTSSVSLHPATAKRPNQLNFDAVSNRCGDDTTILSMANLLGDKKQNAGLHENIGGDTTSFINVSVVSPDTDMSGTSQKPFNKLRVSQKSVSIPRTKIMTPSSPIVPRPDVLPSPRTPLAPTKYVAGSPNVGPLLASLFCKLELMMQNSLCVNLLLTDLISRLASYPQPLIRSFLLNHSLVFQPTVKSLMQVLSSVRQKIDSYAKSMPNFDQLLAEALYQLAIRDEACIMSDHDMSSAVSSTSGSESSSSPQTTTRKQRTSSVSDIGKGDRWRTGLGFGDFILRVSPAKDYRPRNATQLPRNKKLDKIPDTSIPINKLSTPPGGHWDSIKTKSAIYCAVVLDEFVKELAALAQEHAVVSVSDIDRVE